MCNACMNIFIEATMKTSYSLFALCSCYLIRLSYTVYSGSNRQFVKVRCFKHINRTHNSFGPIDMHRHPLKNLTNLNFLFDCNHCIVDILCGA